MIYSESYSNELDELNLKTEFFQREFQPDYGPISVESNSFSSLLNKLNNEERLAVAAEALLPDYLSCDELTIFTSLDGENFNE
jgi:hypothetical protein